jgi:hypothetical protein
MILEKIKVIESDNPTPTGRIYPSNVVEKMYKKIAAAGPHERFGEMGMPESHTVNLSNVAFTYENPFLEDGNLYVDIHILETPKGKELKEMVGDMVFTTAGIGIVDEDNIVQDDYELISINAIPKDDS